MYKTHREKNLLRSGDRSAGVRYDKSLVSPAWGSKDGNEKGYNRTYGDYGSAARGWADKPHSRSFDLEDKILREKFVTEESAEDQEMETREEIPRYEGKGPRNYQ